MPVSPILRARRGADRRPGNDRVAQLGVGCDCAMEANQMQPRTGNQRGQALHELQRGHDLAAFEPFIGNGGAGDVAA